MTTVPQSERTESKHRAFARVVVTKSEMLPATCPACLAPGVRDMPVGQVARVAALLSSKDASLTAHYCDLCADRIENAATRSLALVAALSIFGIAVATAGALWLGSLAPFSQVLAAVAAPLLPALLLQAAGVWQRPSHSLYQEEERSVRRDARTLLVANPEFLHQLSGHEDGSRVVPTLAPWPLLLVAPLIGLGWSVSLHHFGNTQIGVVHADEEPATLLIDGRKRHRVAPTLREHPSAGRRISALGGRRLLSLVSADGRILAEQEVTLWPNHTYLFGSAPPGSCFALQKREYGSVGSGHELSLLPETGPIWELKQQVDRWFSPLAERADLPTTGGVRTALRLVPCTPSAQSSPDGGSL